MSIKLEIRSFVTAGRRQRPLVLLLAVCFLLGGSFYVFQPNYGGEVMLPTKVGSDQLLIDGAKELSEIVTMLVTLTTGMFVALALVSKQHLRPSARPHLSWMFVAILFFVGAAVSFYYGIHAKYAIAQSILSRYIDSGQIENLIRNQSWAVATSGACVASLIGEALFAKD